MKKGLTVNQLKQLRSEIVLCSLYMKDYENSFMTKEKACSLFDGYAEYLEDLMLENVENFNDSKFFEYLDRFDNIDTLKDYYFVYSNLFTS